MAIPKEKEIVFSFLERLKELNWFYFDNFQRNNNQEVLDQGKLFKQLQEINPSLTNNITDRVIEKLLDPHLENQQFLNYLRSGITIHANGESHWVQLIDFQQPERNKFRYLSSPYFPVCNQHGTRFYPDLVLFVNYLPLVVCEFKDWGKNNWKEVAYREGSGGSIEKYHKELPQLFRFNAFNVLSNGWDCLIGTTTKRSELFNYTPWRWEKYLHNIFSPTVLCDTLENFLIFTKSKNKRIIRYHQYACLQEVLKVVSQRKIKEGIVVHTTGSGKSDTMVFLAKKLRQEYRQCTIIVITDRQELDLQLLGRFQDYEDVFFTPKEFIVITSIKNLEENLTKPNLGKIIFVIDSKIPTSRIPTTDFL